MTKHRINHFSHFPQWSQLGPNPNPHFGVIFWLPIWNLASQVPYRAQKGSLQSRTKGDGGMGEVFGLTKTRV